MPARERQRLVTNHVQQTEGFSGDPNFPKQSKYISKSDRASQTAIELSYFIDFLKDQLNYLFFPKISMYNLVS